MTVLPVLSPPFCSVRRMPSRMFIVVAVLAAGFFPGRNLLAQSDSSRNSSIHLQATVVSQFHPPFSAAYSGTRSLSPGSDGRTSFTSTLFLGWRPFPGTEIYLNPELSAGSGLSGTTGIAGFPNGEIYRVDNPRPVVSLARLFLRQIIGLSDHDESLEDGQNQIRGPAAERRFVLTVGKFSLLDIFDNNSWSHEPRRDFLNWAFMANGAWDYPADTRGSTIGVAVEYVESLWAVRMAAVAVPLEANGLVFDSDVKNANGLAAEIEVRSRLTGIPGIIRAVAYRNRARMGRYRDALGQNPVDIASVRHPGGIKWGFGLNYEVAFAQDLGLFARAGWSDGTNETWAFTEIDRTAGAGISAGGDLWGRRDDRASIAAVVNGLSADHRDYLAAGGYGFIIGDGALTYGWETIIETQYRWSVVSAIGLSADYQFVVNPAYNRDRGPVHVFALRAHVEI